MKKIFLIKNAFSKKKFKKPEILFFVLQNSVGWVSHVVLALNQLKRPKKGQIQLKKPKNSIVENLKFFDLIFRWYFPFSMLILWLQNLVLYVNNQIQSRNRKSTRSYHGVWVSKGVHQKPLKIAQKRRKCRFCRFDGLIS